MRQRGLSAALSDRTFASSRARRLLRDYPHLYPAVIIHAMKGRPVVVIGVVRRGVGGDNAIRRLPTTEITNAVGWSSGGAVEDM